MSFKLELEKRVASQEKTIFQKAKLIEDRGKSPFPTMKRTTCTWKPVGVC